MTLLPVELPYYTRLESNYF